MKTLREARQEEIAISKYKEFLDNPEEYSKEFFLRLFEQFKNDLNEGVIRVVEKKSNEWKVNKWIKQLIIYAFKYGNIKQMSNTCENMTFDKDTLGSKKIQLSDGIRIVSQGVSIRDGCYISKGVICMPPSFINIGAYIDEDTLIDSNTLVGSCARIGKRVHLSAGTQIGGVLEPVGQMPVIIEDDVFIGGSSGIFDGTIVKKGATIGAGTIINRSVKIYDIVKNKIYSCKLGEPLVVPEGALVVPGSRKINCEAFGDVSLSVNTCLIVKYKQTFESTIKLEDALRT